ncbi:MAG TPA: haloacid dehalogenase [Anaerolineae bacterium]|nr:haloacid dehalogenase [Caldilineae bacterium]HID35099.1 haloacid dehalogenase [Anaerolineae bacterium]
MDNLNAIMDSIRRDLDARNEARDQALKRSRDLIRHCSLSIRACHRHAFDKARELLAQVDALAAQMSADLAAYPDLYYAGYTRDALKEVVEAHLVYALIHHDPLPTPEALNVPSSVYLGGLAEAATEMRRFILDLIRQDRLDEAEAYFVKMDEIYSILVTIDFPDALTGGLRRQTDIVRGVTERTRGDLTVAVRQRRLERALQRFESMVSGEDA